MRVGSECITGQQKKTAEDARYVMADTLRRRSLDLPVMKHVEKH
jgi:hypothetical protein